MEDLQIALNSARVEHRNQGLWIKAWHVGQTLQALVVDKMPVGDTLLRINGNHLVVPGDIPVQKGARLMLEVTQMTPAPTLRLLEVTNPALSQGNLAALSELTQKLSRQARQLIPHQGNINSALLSLFGIQAVTNVPPVTNEIIESLRKSIPHVKELKTPGLFAEALLLMGGFSNENSRSINLKESLIRLYSILSGEGVDPTLANYAERIQAALSGLALSQLATLHARESGSGEYFIDFPVWFRESLVVVNFVFVEEQNTQDTEGQGPRWKLCMRMDLPEIGQVSADIYVNENRLSVAISAEREAFLELLEAQLSLLESRLEAVGLSVSVVCCRMSDSPYLLPMNQFSGSLDERV